MAIITTENTENVKSVTMDTSKSKWMKWKKNCYYYGNWNVWIFFSISELLDSKKDGIEVSYNAAGVLAHIASDGADAWTLTQPQNVRREFVLQRMVSLFCLFFTFYPSIPLNCIVLNDLMAVLFASRYRRLSRGNWRRSATSTIARSSRFCALSTSSILLKCNIGPSGRSLISPQVCNALCCFFCVAFIAKTKRVNCKNATCH